MTEGEAEILKKLRIKIEVYETYNDYCLGVKLLYKGKEISQDEVTMYPDLYHRFIKDR